MNLKQYPKLIMIIRPQTDHAPIYLTGNWEEKTEIHDSEIREEDQRDDGKRILT